MPSHMTRHPGTCEVEQWPARREAFRDAIRKARGLVHGRTCEFCHTTFGEPSEEQFYPCWTRHCEEHERLIAEGKIPAPKLISPSGRGPARIRQNLCARYAHRLGPTCALSSTGPSMSIPTKNSKREQTKE